MIIETVQPNIFQSNPVIHNEEVNRASSLFTNQRFKHQIKLNLHNKITTIFLLTLSLPLLIIAAAYPAIPISYNNNFPAYCNNVCNENGAHFNGFLNYTNLIQNNLDICTNPKDSQQQLLPKSSYEFESQTLPLTFREYHQETDKIPCEPKYSIINHESDSDDIYDTFGKYHGKFDSDACSRHSISNPNTYGSIYSKESFFYQYKPGDDRSHAFSRLLNSCYCLCTRILSKMKF